MIRLTEADTRVADALLSHQLDLFRLEAGARNKALAILDQMGSELEATLRRADITATTRARTEALLKQAADVIDGYYTTLSTTTQATLHGAAAVQANVVAQALNSTMVFTIEAQLPATAYLDKLVSNALVQGAKTAAWWKRQAGDTSFKFASAVRQGLAAGETQQQILQRVVGSAGKPGVVTNIAKWNARSLIHSSVMSISAQARRDTFQQNRAVVKGIRQISTFDSHTTVICIAYGGAAWDMDYNPIAPNDLPYNGGVPRHWGCRSVEVPITKSFKELGINMPESSGGNRASDLGPVDAGMTFSEFLKRKGAAFQDEVLGPGRAQLYRDGKLTVQQLLDLKGNPLSVAQLKKKYS